MKHPWTEKLRIAIKTPALTAALVATSACTPTGSSTSSEATAADRSPIQLTAWQMDRVSASGVGVDMDLSALALGQFGDTDTDAMTGVVTVGPTVIGYGFGSGEAVACCGDDAEVQLDVTASGEGDYVFSDTHTAYGGDGVRKFAVGQGVVLALSGPSREELVAETRAYLDQIALAPPSTYRPRTELFASETEE